MKKIFLAIVAIIFTASIVKAERYVMVTHTQGTDPFWPVVQKGGEDDRYEDERKGRLKENYRRQTGYRKPANWKTNANHLVGQKGNNLTKGRNMVYLLKYLISRSGLAK